MSVPFIHVILKLQICSTFQESNAERLNLHLTLNLGEEIGGPD